MSSRLRKHLTYANVVASIALFLALSTGGAYAATQWTGANIKNGTLTSADIKNGTVTSADVKGAQSPFVKGTLTQWDVADGSLTGTDVADGSVTSADVADGSLTGADVADNGITSDDVAPLHGDLDIQDNTITTFDLGANSVDYDEVLDFGLANEDIGVLYAQINADGTVASSSGGVTAIRLGAGQYAVDFGRNVSAAAFVATQGDSGTGAAGGAVMGVADRLGNTEAVYVSSHDYSGVLEDAAFHLVVVF